MLAVADLAGAGGLARLDAAEMVIDPDGEQSARLLLLGDLRDLFDKEPSGVLFTAEILKALNDRDDRPWSAWGKAGKGLTGRSHWLDAEAVRYLDGAGRDGAVSTWRRVTSGRRSMMRSRATCNRPPFWRSQGYNPQKPSLFAGFEGLQPKIRVTPRNAEKPRQSAGCNPVTPGVGVSVA